MTKGIEIKFLILEAYRTKRDMALAWDSVSHAYRFGRLSKESYNELSSFISYKLQECDLQINKLQVTF